MPFLNRLMPWGPVFFGVLIFAPMWAAAMDATHLSLPIDITVVRLPAPVSVKQDINLDYPT